MIITIITIIIIIMVFDLLLYWSTCPNCRHPAVVAQENYTYILLISDACRSC